MGTAALRGAFLLTDLFQPGRLPWCSPTWIAWWWAARFRMAIWSCRHCTRMGRGGFRNGATGIVNIGDRGTVMVGETRYTLERFDCLYVGKGDQAVRLCRSDEGQPVFFPLQRAGASAAPDYAGAGKRGNAEPRDENTCLTEVRPQADHLDGVASCQLVMGRTEIAENSVWNTMPAHTHGRRCEVYLYVDLGEGMAVNRWGRRANTRHLIVRDRQAVLSPGSSHSLRLRHQRLSLVWAMAGENQDFADVDAAAVRICYDTQGIHGSPLLRGHGTRPDADPASPMSP